MTSRPLSKAKRQAYAEELHTAGLRATPARIAVLDALHRASAPRSHAELCRQLSAKRLDPTTIYRNLVALTEAGLCVRSDHGDRRWRFELARGAHEQRSTHRHPHFLCTDCGGVSCLPEVEVRVPKSENLPRSTHAGHFEVQLRGLCDRCTIH